ncbi:protein of unknown function [Paenibacillus sp. UNC496MF]|uniref:DUF4183 domain-containing protein n=1 Tax=Paenibacillus sp. UNC496MF TaxID=1502753 RepID=UPI0008E9A680|nr:DUF4183 domain-containing protein [Paenibacillus sp. UNC496MF]SFJ24024.1 protein of unknown function [Paenibacillus sp. UNC496MF]
MAGIRVIPDIRRYFYAAPAEIGFAEAVAFPAADFVNDAGEPVSSFADFGQSGYYNLYLNGVVQQGQAYHAAPEGLTIYETGQTVAAGTPIILETVGFQAVPTANS